MNDTASGSGGHTGGLSVAVLIPCLNEEATVAAVVADFRTAVPGARIYVYDNASDDATAAHARRAGATVRREPARGKGNVVRRMFGDVDADVFVLVDGDRTYPADAAPAMIATLAAERLDMVAGARVASGESPYPPGHRLGNALITGLVGVVFGRRFRDILTGYRVLSRRFVKCFPALSAGFEIEKELAVHALRMRMPVTEVDVRYVRRPPGSASKLRTVRDAMTIVRTILLLVKEERPLAFFAGACALLELAAAALGWPVVVEYAATGLVPRLPTAVLATGIALLGALALASGLVLDSVARGRLETKRLAYLGHPPPRHPGAHPDGAPAATTRQAGARQTHGP